MVNWIRAPIMVERDVSKIKLTMVVPSEYGHSAEAYLREIADCWQKQFADDFNRRLEIEP